MQKLKKPKASDLVPNPRPAAPACFSLGDRHRLAFILISPPPLPFFRSLPNQTKTVVSAASHQRHRHPHPPPETLWSGSTSPQESRTGAARRCTATAILSIFVAGLTCPTPPLYRPSTPRARPPRTGWGRYDSTPSR